METLWDVHVHFVQRSRLVCVCTQVWPTSSRWTFTRRKSRASSAFPSTTWELLPSSSSTSRRRWGFHNGPQTCDSLIQLREHASARHVNRRLAPISQIPDYRNAVIVAKSPSAAQRWRFSVIGLFRFLWNAFLKCPNASELSPTRRGSGWAWRCCTGRPTTLSWRWATVHGWLPRPVWPTLALAWSCHVSRARQLSTSSPFVLFRMKERKKGGLTARPLFQRWCRRRSLLSL